MELLPLKLGKYFNDGIVITFDNGKVEVLDCDLKELRVSDQFIEFASVFFTEFYCFNNDFKVIIVGIPKDKQKINMSLYHYRKDGKGQTECVSCLSVEMDQLSSAKNYGYSFDGRHLAAIGIF